jgi:hypothetical protein
MVLRSFKFFCSEGDWSRYLTIKSAMEVDPGIFLGSVDILVELPSTISEARSLWSLGDYTIKVTDTAFVNVDGSHNDNPSQYAISSIDGENLTWKYQFSIPIPGNQYELKANKATNFLTINDTLYPSVKAVNDLFNTFNSLPAGGSIGQALVKRSASNYDVMWSDGGTGDVAVDNVSIDYNSSNQLEVKNLGVTTAKIANKAVTTGKLDDSSVTTAKIVDSAVTEPKLATNSVTTDKIVNLNVTTGKLADNSVTTAKIVNGNVTEPKLATNSVSTLKIVDGNVTTPKLADDAVTTPKLADEAVTTAKIGDKNVTPAKLSVGLESQVLRTVGNEALWSQEVDVSNKADKFLYTPTSGAETLYNLEDIQRFNVEGNGAGVDPNSGIVWTNFAGEKVSIDIDGLPGYFNYMGQVDTWERLPVDDLSNGDLYSVYGPINFKGPVDTVVDLPTNADDLDQYYITDIDSYQYWSSIDGSWITNHCQVETGCDESGWYIFAVGEPNQHWNRLDSDLAIDQVLSTTSVNAIANKAVATSLLTKLNMFSPNTLSEFFNENDGGGLVFKDTDGHEVAGITLNTIWPQLYLHRFSAAGDLIKRVLFEIHEDGAYISTALVGTNWTRLATKADIDDLFRDYLISTDYRKNTFVREHIIDSSVYNRYGIVTHDYESVDYDVDIDNGDIDEIVGMKELKETLDYCIDNFFPDPVITGV